MKYAYKNGQNVLTLTTMTESDDSKIPEEYYVKGFLFPCSSSHLNRPICLNDSEVEEMPDGSGNRDMIFIRCKRCDRMMTYRAGTDDHSHFMSVKILTNLRVEV